MSTIEGHTSVALMTLAPRGHRFRLSPLLAAATGAAALALGFGSDTGPFGFQLWSAPSCSSAEAVDISLRCTMRPLVVRRLQRENRLNAPPERAQATIDDELGRARDQALYVICEFPDDLEPIAKAVRFVACPGDEIERGPRGNAPN